MERIPDSFNLAAKASMDSTEPAMTTSLGALSFATTTPDVSSISAEIVSASDRTAIMAPACVEAASAMNSPRLRADTSSFVDGIRPAAANADSSPKLCPAAASGLIPIWSSRLM